MTSKPEKKRKTVLILLPVAYQDGMDKFDGILKYMNEKKPDWRLKLVRLTVDDPVPSPRVDGIIMNGTTLLSLCRAVTRRPCPLVALDWYSPAIVRNRRNCHRICVENDTIGRLAAQTFLKYGPYTTFACCPKADKIEWSTVRQRAFVRKLGETGHACVTLDPALPLERQLLALRRPAAVFAVNDSLATRLLEAAAAAGLRVPHDISVLGVDNERISCLTSNPTLSSIQPDFVKAGYLAARTLDRIFRGERPPGLQRYPVKDVIHRRSIVPPGTATRIVQAAKAIIRDSPKLSNVDFIAAQVGVSRRLLDCRFRQLEGTSVLAYIQGLRIDQLKTSLRTTSQSIGEICAHCGFGTGTYPQQLFRRLTGMSMRDYRKQPRRATMRQS